jgi:nitrate/nitrite-specific signal transduction histidine kinase
MTSQQPTPQATDNLDIMQQVLIELRELKQDVGEYKQSVEQYQQDVEQYQQDVEQYQQGVEQYQQDVEQFNQKFDNYQKATQWMVQLAFSLIAAATVTVIVSTVLGN